MSTEQRAEPLDPTDVLQPVFTSILERELATQLDVQSTATLKRRASLTFDDDAERSSRKKLKEDNGFHETETKALIDRIIDGNALADELEQELQCGCCSALVYRPVMVSPCQHFFCGSCLVLWIRSGGTNCPACRGVSVSASPSRALQTMTDVLVRSAPSKARTISEMMQADEIYKAGLSLRIPSPKQASPEPNIPQSNGTHIRPCPHCVSGNQWGWRCPQPIPDPEADPNNAWHADNGTPPGHGYCGNCENILSLQAPSTSKCDFCQVSFCGISIPDRCVAAPLIAQHPHGFSDLGDLIQCGEVYECFDHNTVEVDIMLDYITAQGITPKHIYREIIAMILRSSRQFTPLFEQELFVDLHVVAGGIDPDPSTPRRKICRMCASEVLLWGLRDWWVQERKKGFLEADVMSRPDCPDGVLCTRQKDHAHAKEFNHIISTPEPPTQSQPEARQQPLIPPLGNLTSPENVLDPQSHGGQQPERMVELPMENSATSIFRQVVELHSNLEGSTVGSQPMTAIPDALVPSSQDQVNAML